MLKIKKAQISLEIILILSVVILGAIFVGVWYLNNINKQQSQIDDIDDFLYDLDDDFENDPIDPPINQITYIWHYFTDTQAGFLNNINTFYYNSAKADVHFQAFAEAGAVQYDLEDVNYNLTIYGKSTYAKILKLQIEKKNASGIYVPIDYSLDCVSSDYDIKIDMSGNYYSPKTSFFIKDILSGPEQPLNQIIYEKMLEGTFSCNPGEFRLKITTEFDDTKLLTLDGNQSLAEDGLESPWGNNTYKKQTTEYIEFVVINENINTFLKITSGKSQNGRVYLKYEPNSSSKYQEINLVGYGLEGYNQEIIYLDEPINLAKDEPEVIFDHGIMLDNFNIILYAEIDLNYTYPIIKNIIQDIKEPILSSCPNGYISVPGNYLYNTVYQDDYGFCVMKYEAKVDADEQTQEDCYYSSDLRSWNHRKVNESSGIDCNVFNFDLISQNRFYPIGNVTHEEAKQLCETIDGGHLITNDEWMTIVRNIELNTHNWTENPNGNYLPKGNHNTSDGAANKILTGLDSIGTGVNKRSLRLNSNEEIFDLSGNMWEWVDKEIDIRDDDCLPYCSLEQPSGGSFMDNWTWLEYSFKDQYTGYVNEIGERFNSKEIYMLKTTYNSNNGVGKINTKKTTAGGLENRVMLRGGTYNSFEKAGVIAVNLKYQSSYSAIPNDFYVTGFRCVVLPKETGSPPSYPDD
jgi:hypothetical protein